MRVEPAVPPDALAAIRAVLATAGAEVVDAPILQPLNLLLDLAGEAMRARLFVVQAEGGVEECLRPDFTVAVARAHIDSTHLAGWYSYEGPAFRASPGGDRPEQFVQLGVEYFQPPGLGSDVQGDVEIIDLAWQAASAGGRSDLTLWLGDVGLFAAFIDSLGLADTLAARLKRVAGRPRLLNAELARIGVQLSATEPGQLAAMLSRLTEGEAATLIEEVWTLAGVEPVGGRGAGEIAARLVRRANAASDPALTEGQAAAIRDFMAISDAPPEALDQVRALAGKGHILIALGEWQARLAHVTHKVGGDRMRFAPALGHAFDYYDGLTFEVRSDALGPDRAIATGGRYDGLLTRLGGSAKARAVGCVVRPWRAYSGGEA